MTTFLAIAAVTFAWLWLRASGQAAKRLEAAYRLGVLVGHVEAVDDDSEATDIQPATPGELAAADRFNRERDRQIGKAGMQ